jgi:uncharacterized protein YbjT (DUF2867 family)
MPDGKFTVVFGGTGFLGRRIVSALTANAAPVRIAARHPRAPDEVPHRAAVTVHAVDVTDIRSVRRAVACCAAVVNCISLYHEHGAATFEAVHVDGAATVAKEAADAGVVRLIHLSGIGSDPASSSPYIAARGRGEAAVRAAFPQATFFRPSVMFGENDRFIMMLSDIIRRAPVIPLFGDGSTRLQPVYVGDVADAAVNALGDHSAAGQIYELGGPEVLSYREILQQIAAVLGRRRVLAPIPFSVWSVIANLARPLANPPITEGQVALMQHDNTATHGMPGLTALGIAPTPLGTVLSSGVVRAG